MNMNKKQEYEEKLLLSLNNNLRLHLLLTDESWRNGYVKEISNDFFIFIDDVNGEEPIFFLDLKEVKPFRKEVRE